MSRISFSDAPKDPDVGLHGKRRSVSGSSRNGKMASRQASQDDYPEVPNVSSPMDENGFLGDDDSDRYGHDACGDPGLLPPIHTHRTLVLCFDGTGDSFDADNSNIVQFFSMLKKDDRRQQMVYYQAGIGTYTIPQIATPLYAKFSKTLDMMVGVHLNAHVMGGYEFLMENYEAGDKICIFGFSRGAYTARALAGMIHKVGLLPASNHQQVPFAYKMYTREDDVGWAQSSAFKKAFSMDVDIEFLGTWDTVSSVGIIPRFLPFVRSNTHVRHFRHAISLDERRARFKPNVWARPNHEQEHHLSVKKGDMPRSTKYSKRQGLPDFTDEEDSPRSDKEKDRQKHKRRQLERAYSMDDKPTDVDEVWFAGCHCDVGGGSVINGTRHSLARIPLRWMIRQCFATRTGILFHRDMFPSVGLAPHTLHPTVLPRPPPVTALPTPEDERIKRAHMRRATSGTLVLPDAWDFVSEEVEDFKDAMSPMYDQLKLAKGWWILEVIPQKQRFQKDDDKWARVFSVNMGHGRHIPRQKKAGMKVHRTVRIRMDAPPGTVDAPNDKKEKEVYVPRAKFKVEPTWVA